MKPILQLSVCLVAFTLALVPCGIASAQAVESLEARVAELEAQLAERDAEIARLRAMLEQITKQVSDSIEQTRQREQQLDQREADLEVMAGAITTGEFAERFENLVTVRPDERRGRTVVTAGPLAFEDEPLVGDLFLSAVYSLPGDSSHGTPESVTLFVLGQFTGGQFGDAKSLTFDVAGEQIEIPVADYQLVRKSGGLPGRNRTDKSNETVTLLLDLPTVRRLAEAPALTMQTPRGVVVWQREQRALLRALLSRMEAPASP